MSWVAVAVAGAAVVGGVVSAQGQKSAAKTAASSADAASQLQYEMYQQQRQDLAPWQQAGAGAINALWGTPAQAEQTIQGAPIYGTVQGQNAIAPQDEQPVWHQIMDYNWETSQMEPKWVFAPMTTNAISAPAAPQQVITGYQPNQTIPGTPGTQGLIQKGPGEFTESPSYQFALQQGLQAQQRAASATGRLGSGAYLKDATSYAKNLASEEYQNFLNRYYQSLEPYFRMAGMGTSTANTLSSAGQNYASQAGNYMTQAGQAQAAGQLGQANTLANMMNWGGQQYGNYAYANQLQNQNALSNYWANNPYTGAQMNTMSWL